MIEVEGGGLLLLQDNCTKKALSANTMAVPVCRCVLRQAMMCIMNLCMGMRVVATWLILRAMPAVDQHKSHPCVQVSRLWLQEWR